MDRIIELVNGWVIVFEECDGQMLAEKGIPHGADQVVALPLLYLHAFHLDGAEILERKAVQGGIGPVRRLLSPQGSPIF